jgi:ketosteroid isomerase-like protein
VKVNVMPKAPAKVAQQRKDPRAGIQDDGDLPRSVAVVVPVRDERPHRVRRFIDSLHHRREADSVEVHFIVNNRLLDRPGVS